MKEEDVFEAILTLYKVGKPTDDSPMNFSGSRDEVYHRLDDAVTEHRRRCPNGGAHVVVFNITDGTRRQEEHSNTSWA